MFSIGIDIGYAAIKAIVIDDQQQIQYSKYSLHKGRVKDTLKGILNDLLTKYNQEDIKYGAVTGSGSKFLSKMDEAHFINEVAAIVEGSEHMVPGIESIIQIGGEGAKYITGIKGKDKSQIEISMNSNCSAGTGSFLEEQMSRLNLKLEDYSVYAGRAKSIPRIAGRCSVFAKTDITHHQQEGVPVEDILLGLAYAVIKNYKGAVMKRLPVKKPLLFIGGVAHNQGIITAIKDVLHLEEGELVIPDNFSNIEAIGAALIAKNEGILMDFQKINDSIELLDENYHVDDSDIDLPKLAPYGDHDGENKHICKPINQDKNAVTNVYLGVDIGSTSTNLVLMNEEHEIISFKYLRTLGNPVEAVKIGLKELNQEFGNRIKIIGASTTGSGRYMIGEMIGADVIKDEITAQAKAATTIDNTVDTIFEIGGQDSKYISIQGGVVADFQMNKICAAGTGSFIEEQSKKFNIPVHELGGIALSSKHPIYLGERCTVFIETSIAANLSRGADLEDIASGLCYSIVKNYLNRVVGQKKIGDKVFLQGGIAYNQGIVNAFRALTGKQIVVPPFFSVTGAYGAAILAKEALVNKSTQFKGFDIEWDQASKGRKKTTVKVAERTSFNDKMNDLVFQDYDGTIDPAKKTVGIPRALFTYGMYPMFSTFFKELGLNILLSDKSDENTVKLAQETSLDETCFPVKLINGHVAELVQKNVDYIFFPDLFTVDHPDSPSRQNYGCAYMQLAFKIVKRAMELGKKGIELLSPTIAFNLGPEFMKESFAKLGKQLGRSEQDTKDAITKGVKAFHDFEDRLEENGREIVDQLRPDEKAFVIISKTYGVVDPLLNMSIPDKLMSMGYKVLSFTDLPEGDTTVEYPNMFWPFGMHILEAAQIVKAHPNLYAVYLSHHCCGPDTILTHYFREIMGDKPYLNIEVDEHSSGVGVITRVEAFINSLNKEIPRKAEKMEVYTDKIAHEAVNIKGSLNEIEKNASVYLPYIYPYAQIFEALLKKKGLNVKVFKETSRSSVNIGREFIMTNEYFSLTALLGDVFKMLRRSKPTGSTAILLPRSEGAEVDGQYSRLLRMKLNEEGHKDVDIVSPYIEDALDQEDQEMEATGLALIAGDLIRLSDRTLRKDLLANILQLIETNTFNIDSLKSIAEEVYRTIKTKDYTKHIFAMGEPSILYNDFMNQSTFKHIEEKGYRVVYAPLSEWMWFFWKDFLDNNGERKTMETQNRLDKFIAHMRTISECLKEVSPFEEDLEQLIDMADQTIGYYAGSNGRYRESKLLGTMNGIDGIMTVASMYENTGIALNVLHKGFKNNNSKPLLNLTFDGNKNENDRTKIESFIYYI